MSSGPLKLLEILACFFRHVRSRQWSCFDIGTCCKSASTNLPPSIVRSSASSATSTGHVLRNQFDRDRGVRTYQLLRTCPWEVALEAEERTIDGVRCEVA